MQDMIQITAKSNMSEINTKEEYDKLLKSGMFWVCYPELSGNWEADKQIIHNFLHNEKNYRL